MRKIKRKTGVEYKRKEDGKKERKEGRKEGRKTEKG